MPIEVVPGTALAKLTTARSVTPPIDGLVVAGLSLLAVAPAASLRDIRDVSTIVLASAWLAAQESPEPPPLIVSEPEPEPAPEPEPEPEPSKPRRRRRGR